MIGYVARGLFSRCLPVVLALVLSAAGGSPVERPRTSQVAAVSGERHSASAEQASDSTADDTVAVVAAGDRERVLTAQNTVSVGASRAPPVTAA